MERKNMVSLMVIVAFVAAVIFAGCAEETSVSTPSPEVATAMIVSEPLATPLEEEPQQITFSGSGNRDTPLFWLYTGWVTFRMTHDGDHFVVDLLDDKGNIVSNLVFVLDGPSCRSSNVSLTKDGYYLLDISADGNWTITIEQSSIE